VYPTIAKYWLAKRGVNISTVTRRDVGSFSSTVRKNIEDLYYSYLLLKNQVGINGYL
jgi:4-hydroxy-tetrahydrodipicolinate synthase